MRCAHCGANIPEDQMICPECGAEVQIVPDYNPLEDVLAREVKGSVEGATRQIKTDDIRRYRRDSRTQNINSTRVLSQGELDRIREERRAGYRRPSQVSRNTGSGGRSTTGSMKGTGTMRSGTGTLRTAEERRRQQQQKRLEAAKKKRRNLLLTMFFLLVLIGAGIYVAYQNSYTGVVKKGNRALQEGNYTAAQNYFNRAVTKDKSRPDAYKGLSDVYADQDDLEGAEAVYLTALETQPSNARLYQAAIDFYVETEQLAKISVLLEDCEDQDVLKAVAEYVSDAPVFSLEEGTYEEVQQVTLSTDTGGIIYYTTDGTDPTESSTKYEEPVLLQNEGETEIRAIAVNENGIPSAVASGKYTIEFPIANAPAVTPSTGQYSEPEQITINVPEGYTAYYTLDGSTPTTSSDKYTGPVEMPADQKTVFSAVLVNDQNGKATAVTTRTYFVLSE